MRKLHPTFFWTVTNSVRSDFVIVLCGLGVIYNSACAYFLTQLFEQSAPIPIDISLYTYFATFINILGVCGTIKVRYIFSRAKELRC